MEKMLATVTLLLALISRTAVGVSTGIKECGAGSSIDISAGIKSDNGSITYQGVTYETNEYYFDNKTNVPRGCICYKKLCIRKCCAVGSRYYFLKGNKKCVNDSVDFDPPIWDQFWRVKDAHVGELFHLLSGKPKCSAAEARILVKEAFKDMHITTDGQLYVDLPAKSPPWELHGPDKYCIDTFVTEDRKGEKTYKLDALVCFKVEQDGHNLLLTSSGMLISCVFILATCAVYTWLPELRNLHGRVLMAYLLSLFVAFLFMATMQILLHNKNTTRPLCNVFTFIIYFGFQSTFFWLNVMCFDIWWTFSGKRGLSLEKLSTRARFRAYAAYAFGCSTVLTVLLAALEFSGLENSKNTALIKYLPRLQRQGCFLFGTARLIYLYGPMTILCIVNIIFFVLTAIKLWVEIKNQSAVLQNKESSSNSNHDKQRLLLYVKLFIVMGVNWILESISALFPEANIFWTITDVYNILIGLTIFLILVCKRKIFRLIKKRYKQLRGDPMSRTHTTESSRTTSTKEDFRMTSMKQPNK